MGRPKKVGTERAKCIGVKPDTHHRLKIISALKGKEMTEVAEAAVKALEEKWGITLPLELTE